MTRRRPPVADDPRFAAPGAPGARTGFTLIEMLVVISIIALAVGAAFPVLSSITRDTYTSTAINAVGIGVSAARGYADRDIDFNADLTPERNQGNTGQYNGVAALFTPSNEIRLVENDQYALASSAAGVSNPGGGKAPFYLERIAVRGRGRGLSVSYDVSGDKLSRSLNGFTDLQVDYVSLPGGAGLAGIKGPPGSGGGGPPELVAPPFAVWFSAEGSMVVGDQPDQYVYYDGVPGTNGIDIQMDRDSLSSQPYDPTPYDPSAAGYKPSHYNNDQDKYNLPFEKIDTVIGVIVFNKRDMKLAGLWWNKSGKEDDRWDWLKDHGRFVMFTKQSGAVIREGTSR